MLGVSVVQSSENAAPSGGGRRKGGRILEIDDSQSRTCSNIGQAIGQSFQWHLARATERDPIID